MSKEPYSVVFTNRTKLLTTFRDMKFSQEAIHNVMLSFGPLSGHEEKEMVAGKAIPLVQQCKDEKEAVAVVQKVVDETLASRQ